MKKIDISVPVREQVDYNNQYRRYYNSPVLEMKGDCYIICSQWYIDFKSKLLRWINKESQNSENEIEGGNSIIKFGTEYSGIKILKSLFLYILNTIELFKNNQFETSRLTSNMTDLIQKQTSYENPNHLLNNVRKYLEDNNIITLCDN